MATTNSQIASRTTPQTKISRPAVPGGKAKKLVRACTIKREPAELFHFWRNLENLPRFSRHILSVTQISDKESHWKVRASGDHVVEWDALIINEHENQLIAWESKPDSEIKSAGTIRFAPAPDGHGTEVTISFDYVPPGGRVGAAIAKWIGEEPELQLEEELMRFKALMETGELPTTEGQPTGGEKTKGRTK